MNQELRIQEFVQNIRTSYQQDSEIGIPESAQQLKTSHPLYSYQKNPNHVAIIQDSEIGIPVGTLPPLPHHNRTLR